MLATNPNLKLLVDAAKLLKPILGEWVFDLWVPKQVPKQDMVWSKSNNLSPAL
jgi:hypothetical protein